MRIDDSRLVFAGRGSTALWAVLVGLGRPGARVLLPVNICEIVYPIIIKAGLVPVFYDVDETSGNATLASIEAAYSGDETVMLAVHNFGAPLEIDRIGEWATRRRVFLIEDVCNSLGAHYQGKPLGEWGDAAIFSFGYAKIVEYGLGGALLIKDPGLKEEVERTIRSLAPYSDFHKAKDEEFQTRLRTLRSRGAPAGVEDYGPLYEDYAKYLLYRIGGDHQARIRGLLGDLPANLAQRESKARRYREEIVSQKVRHIEQVEGQVYWRYNLLLEPQIRTGLLQRLRMSQLFASTWYPPIAELFQGAVAADRYSGAIAFGNRVLNLFVDHRVSQDDISKTIAIINSL